MKKLLLTLGLSLAALPVAVASELPPPRASAQDSLDDLPPPRTTTRKPRATSAEPGRGEVASQAGGAGESAPQAGTK
ncbi:MAG: hypothetical protein LDL16_06170, partial [Thiobacillus sp.]|nr:hypothetical protein [Thiobacillus sp.]